MAIEYVGGVSGSRNGNSNATTTQSLTGLTGGIASAPAAGDLVIVVCVVGSQGRNPSQAISGYSTLGTQLNRADDTYDTSLQVSYKVQTATPDTSITIPAQGNIADAQAWAVMVFRGIDTTTPFDVASVSATLNNTGNFDAPAITPTTAGAWIVIAGGGAAATGATYTAPTDFATDWLSSTGADTNDAMVGMGYYTGWTSGEYNPASVTGGSTNTANSWAAWTMALRPADESVLVEVPTGDVSLTAQTPTVVATTNAFLYYVIYDSALGAPSAAQVKAGQNVNGVAAVASGSEVARTTTGEQVFASAATGLTQGASYKVALVWTDNASDSNVAVSDTFTTTDPQTVAVPAGSLTLTGLTPTVTATANVWIDVPAGSLTLTAFAPTVVATDNKTVEVPAGGLTLTGIAPTVTVSDNQAVAVPVGSLTLTANAPTVAVTANVAVEVPAGSLALVVYAPSVLAGGNVAIDVPAASLTLTGLAPSVAVSDNQAIEVPAGALTLTAYAPGVEVSGAEEVRTRRGGVAHRPYRYVARLGGQLYFSDSLEELEAALDAFEQQAQPRAKKKAQARTGTTPKQVARTAPKVQAVEVPDADRERVAQMIAEANRRVRELYEAEARLAMIGRYIELEMIAREMDDEAAVVALSY